jgi:hypothetical protein
VIVQLLSEPLPVLEGRLYLISLPELPSAKTGTIYVTLNKKLKYHPFCADFGPYNLGTTHHVCTILKNLLQVHVLSWGKRNVGKTNRCAWFLFSQQIVALSSSLVWARQEHESELESPRREASLYRWINEHESWITLLEPVSSE